jgi:uncharacterized protein with HEPN domain
LKDDRIYLAHVCDAVERVETFTAGGHESFISDPMIQDAVIRNLEVIGEAVKNLSDELRLANPAVPWKRIAGMRDVLIHHYFGIKIETVWQVIVGHLPLFKQHVDRLLNE